MFKFLEKAPLYPFLIAIYPVLYFLSENINEVSPLAGLRSGLIMLFLCSLAYFFSFILARNGQKAGMIALMIILFFFLIFFVLYAPASRWLRGVELFGSVLGRPRYFIPATLIILLLVAVFTALILRKANASALNSLSLAANFFAVILIVIPIIRMLSHSISNVQHTQSGFKNLPAVAPAMNAYKGNRPDIYYIILDMYTSDNVMGELMDVKDFGFTDELREKGFYVAECSRSNYSKTYYSITSSLNLDYIQNLSAFNDTASIYPFMQQNLVTRSLKQVGYEIYAFESGYSFTELKEADHFLRPMSSTKDILFYPGVSPFESMILQTSAGTILYEYREQISKKLQYLIDSPYVQHRDRIVYALENIPQLAEEPGPKFVFAHILAPHDPFVFEENGDPVVRHSAFSLNNDPEGYNWESYIVAYNKEVKYLNQATLTLVDEIIANSETPPVIIIQGDHGLMRARGNNAHFDIYNAYYFDDISLDGLYSTISPANSFRIVFNNLFGSNYPLLPDQAYDVSPEDNSFVENVNLFHCP